MVFRSSMRERKRYIFFSILEKDSISFEEANKALRNEVLRFLGESGAADAGIIFPKELYNKNKGIIRVANNKVNEAIMCLGLIKEFNIKPEKTLGTLAKYKKIMEE